MNFLKPTNVLEESRPLHFMVKLIGLFPLRSCRFKIINYLHIAILIVGYYVMFYFIQDSASKFFDELMILTDTIHLRRIQFLFNILYMPIMIIPTANNAWKIEKVLHEILSLDEAFKYHLIEFNFKKSMRKDIIHLLAIIISSLCFNLCDYFGYNNESRDYTYVLLWIIYETPDFFNYIVICSFGIILLKIRLRFKKINEFIVMLTQDITTSNNPPSDLISAFRFKFLKNQHAKLCTIASSLNEAYSIQLAAALVSYFFFTCGHLYIICVKVDKTRDLVDVILSGMWMLSNFIKFGYLTFICGSTAMQAELARYLLSEKWLRPGHAKLRKELKDFSQQLLGGSVKFTAHNFCKINYSTFSVTLILWSFFAFISFQFNWTRK